MELSILYSGKSIEYVSLYICKKKRSHTHNIGHMSLSVFPILTIMTIMFSILTIDSMVRSLTLLTCPSLHNNG